MDFRTEPLADLAARVARRDLAARELVDHALAMIDQRDGQVRAFVALDEAGARAQAAAIDERLAAGEQVGPLAGIPIGVKDLEHAAGLPTSFGSARLAHGAPVAGDSVLVARLRAAGCVVVGKTNTPEYGYQADTVNPAFGQTHNPWDLNRSPGGSSGGSGAALAAALVPLATGSDGGGSIRIPSAVCGLTGLKATQGRIPVGGDEAPGSGLLGVVGPMARRAADVAYALDAVCGPDRSDPFALDPSTGSLFEAAARADLPARVAWAPTLSATVDADVAARCAAAVARIADAGVEVVEVDPPFLGDDPIVAWFNLWCAYRLRTLADVLGTEAEAEVDPGLLDQARYARDHLGPADVAAAVDAVWHYSAKLEAVLDQAPLLLCPTIPGKAPVVGRQGTVDGVETPMWPVGTFACNLTRHPAGTVPVGLDAERMPVGLQVIGPHRAEAAVVGALAAIELVLGDDADLLARLDWVG